MRSHPFLAAVLLALAALPIPAAELPKVKQVDLQPLAEQVRRLGEALEFLGAPLPAADRDALKAAAADKDHAVEAIQTILDKHCLLGVHIGAGNKLEVQAGPGKPELAEQGWRVFLVKVDNAAEAERVELRIDSPNALPLFQRSSGKPDPNPAVISSDDVKKRFLDLEMFDKQPLLEQLSGLELEYRILQLYCRDAGSKEIKLGASLWKGKPAVRLAGSDTVTIMGDAQPAVAVKLHVTDSDGKPTTAALTIRDKLGHVYPSMSRRLAPDFGFHPQVYRKDGETVLLQPGKYSVSYTRGPEYLVLQREITVPSAATHEESFALKRWIHPAEKGWYSGDHHVHAAGCAHYESPTEGVTPPDMMRHILGEDVNVGCVLSWGPCWYHQKQFFEGKPNHLSTPTNLMRYDVEVSGFPSSHCGHVCLLRLREQDYPGTKLINDWPSWDLPIFKWAKGQGGVVGFAHSGWGLAPEDPNDPTAHELPNYLTPRMDGIGANEYLVDVAHGMCDFISTVDTPAIWELNIWYHTLNCGYRCRISGETDFPCIYGERVGLGRSYVHLDGKLNFDDWAEGIKNGRCYVSDGLSHLMDFRVNDRDVGVKDSEVRLDKPGTVKVKANVAALLEPKPREETERIRKAPTPTRGNSSYQTLVSKPYWHVERARVGDSRKVPVEVVVNGRAVDKKEIIADGSAQEVEFNVPLKESSWVCLRIFPSSHTNPVFVLVDGKPIRASKKSAEWCLKAIDNCWREKVKAIRKAEQADARAAYDKASEEYKKVLAESVAD
jgi:hypothetical protein